MIQSNGDSQDDFLARERAVLGEDADQFTTPQDNVAEGIGADNDLLGVGDSSEEIGQFESSFPSMDTQAQNEVWTHFRFSLLFEQILTYNSLSVLPLAVQSLAPDLSCLHLDIKTHKNLKASPSLFGK